MLDFIAASLMFLQYHNLEYSAAVTHSALWLWGKVV